MKNEDKFPLLPAVPAVQRSPSLALVSCSFFSAYRRRGRGRVDGEEGEVAVMVGCGTAGTEEEAGDASRNGRRRWRTCGGDPKLGSCGMPRRKTISTMDSLRRRRRRSLGQPSRPPSERHFRRRTNLTASKKTTSGSLEGRATCHDLHRQRCRRPGRGS